MWYHPNKRQLLFMSKVKDHEPDKYNVACFLGHEGVPIATFKKVWKTIYGNTPDKGSLESYTNAFDLKDDHSHSSYDYDKLEY
jgi:hypothetical protein